MNRKAGPIGLSVKNVHRSMLICRLNMYEIIQCPEFYVGSCIHKFTRGIPLFFC